MIVKSFGITIILAVLIVGLAHIYLAYIRRGLIILIGGILAGVLLQFFLPFYMLIPILVIYWIWQIVDSIRLHSKTKNMVPPNA